MCGHTQEDLHGEGTRSRPQLRSCLRALRNVSGRVDRGGRAERLQRDEEHERHNRQALEQRIEEAARLRHPMRAVVLHVLCTVAGPVAARVEHRVHDQRLEEEHELRAHAPRLRAAHAHTCPAKAHRIESNQIVWH